MNVQQLWQAQAIEAPRMSLAYVRHEATKLERRTRLRNALEYLMGAFCIVYFAWHAVSFYQQEQPILAASMGWFVLFSMYYGYRWHADASSRAAPADAGVLDTLRYQRRELERQRDARLRSWRWWIPAALPGFVIMAISMFMEEKIFSIERLVALIVWVIAGTWLSIAWLNQSARRLQREIDALDSLAKPDAGQP
jgi:hypothetical protein